MMIMNRLPNDQRECDDFFTSLLSCFSLSFILFLTVLGTTKLRITNPQVSLQVNPYFCCSFSQKKSTENSLFISELLLIYSSLPACIVSIAKNYVTPLLQRLQAVLSKIGVTYPGRQRRVKNNKIKKIRKRKKESTKANKKRKNTKKNKHRRCTKNTTTQKATRKINKKDTTKTTSDYLSTRCHFQHLAGDQHIHHDNNLTFYVALGYPHSPQFAKQPVMICAAGCGPMGVTERLFIDQEKNRCA